VDKKLLRESHNFVFSTIHNNVYLVSTEHDIDCTNRLTSITQLVHHGMIFVPIGYSFGEGMFEMEKLKGGSPYGAGTYAGDDGSRQPSELELAQAFHQGKYFAAIAKKLKGSPSF